MLEYTAVKQTNKNYNILFTGDEFSELLPSDGSKNALCASFYISLPFFSDSEPISRFYTSLCKSCVKVFFLAANNQSADIIPISASDDRRDKEKQEDTRRKKRTKTRKKRAKKGGTENSFDGTGEILSLEIPPKPKNKTEENTKRSNRLQKSNENGKSRSKKSSHVRTAQGTSSDGMQLFSSFTVTKNDGRLLSLYTDIFVMDGRSPIFYKRIAQTWSVPECRLLDIRSAVQKLRAKTESEPNEKSSATFASEKTVSRSTFKNIFCHSKTPRTDDFYITDDGIILFYNRFEPFDGRVRRSELARIFVETAKL